MHFSVKTVLLLCLTVALSGCAAPKGTTMAEKRNSVLEMKKETLAKLYSEKPEARAKIRKAAGYAVFSNINTNLFLLSTAQGYGVAVDNASGKTTYMKMAQVGVGPGLGIKDFRAVFIFGNKQVLHDFVEKGWEFGGHADAAAKSGEKGAAVGGEAYIANDIEIYQITESGVALQATLSGTKYWQNKALN